MDYETKLKKIIYECINDASNDPDIDSDNVTPGFFLDWIKENVEELRREEIEDEEVFIRYAKDKPEEEIKEYLRLAQEEWDEGWGNAMYYQGRT